MASEQTVAKRLPVKLHQEQVAEHIWLGESYCLDCTFENAWSLYDVASKTHFRDSQPLLEAVPATSSCDSCKAVSAYLIANRQHMPPDVFMAEPCCLYDWKVAMRADHGAPAQPHQELDLTIAIIKPHSDPRTRAILEAELGSDAIIAERMHTMTREDIAFLYTTAYGTEFYT